MTIINLMTDDVSNQNRLTRNREYQRKWRKTHPTPHRERKGYGARWAKEHPTQHRTHINKHRDTVKAEVLTHYSPNEILGCSWAGCAVNDVDMLSLDHINNDGCRHILPGKARKLSGKDLYRWAKREGYPDGLQTMCMNHQTKKAIHYSGLQPEHLVLKEQKRAHHLLLRK